MSRKSNKPIEKRNNKVGNISNKEALEVVEKSKDLPHLKIIKYDLKR